MASTYSDLKIELIGTGEQAGTWGATTNTNLGTALEEAIVGRATANFTADADLTLTLTNVNTTQVARHYILNVTSGVSLTLTRNLIVPTIDKPYIIENNTTGGQSIVVKTTAGTGVTIPNGKRAMVYANSTNVVAATNFIPDLTINSGNIDNTTIGATTPNTGRFTTLNALGNVTLGDSTSLDSHTINGATAVSVNTTTDAFKITQTGTGNAFVVEDSASADATPFVIDANGNVGIGKAPSVKLDVVGDAYFGTVVHTGNGVTTGTAAIELGGLRTGDGLSLIDFHSTSGSDYETRLLKTGGANGNFQIINTGTGDLQLSQTNAGAITFQTTNTERMRIDSAGNVGIGGIAGSAVKLHVLGTLPSSGALSLPVQVSGTIPSSTTSSAQIYKSSPNTEASAFTLTGLNHFYAAQGTIGVGSTVSNQYGFVAESNLIGATNNFGFIGIIPSGTGRWNFYAGGTANNYMAGSLGIGQLSILATKLAIAGTHTGSITSNGIQVFGTVASDVTNAYYGVTSAVSTAAATFTLGSLNHYGANQGTIGAGSSITNQNGFIAENSLIGATNNFGFRGQIPSGTGRYNLYMDGTADNYLGGKLGIGTTALTQFGLRVSLPITGNASSYGVRVDGTVQSDATVVGYGYATALSTQATAFTVGNLNHFTAIQGTIGVGSTVSNQYGFVAESNLIGATNNYGFYGNIASGAGRWNFYAGNTANNAYAGKSAFGRISVPIAGVDTNSFAAGWAGVNTATYTISDTDHTILQLATASTYTLPAASAYGGRILHIVTKFAGTVISASANVVPLAGGAAGTAILAATAGKYAKLQSDGTSWQIIEAN